MKALVTGSTGFVGPYLCAHLEACSDEVLTPGDEHASFDVTDRDEVAAVLGRLRPEVVYHLAARSNVADSWSDPTSCLRTNVEGTQNVLDAARAASVRRVLVVGSAEEYGRVDPRDLPLREDTPLRPLTPYGVSKVAASFAALQAWIGSGLETVRARPFTHTGPGQRPTFAVPALARRIALAERDGADAIVAGALDPVRDISDVRDVVRAYRLLMERGTPGEVYNVCRGTGVSVGEVAQRLLHRAHRRLRLETDPALLRPSEVPRLVGDPSKLRDATGWEPEHSLDATLDAVLADARAQVAQGS
jgi:GDP-4-dehydro-6-deoxy-D-mannose reductase